MKKTYLLDEIAEEFRVTRRTVERWIKDGELDAIKIGHTRRVTSDALDVIKKKERQFPSNDDN